MIKFKPIFICQWPLSITIFFSYCILFHFHYGLRFLQAIQLRLHTVFLSLQFRNFSFYWFDCFIALFLNRRLYRWFWLCWTLLRFFLNLNMRNILFRILFFDIFHSWFAKTSVLCSRSNTLLLWWFDWMILFWIIWL